MADLFLDTDIFVDHLRRRREFRPGQNQISYSIVTRCELFAGNPSEESRVRNLLDPLLEIPVDRAIAERAGRLRRSTKMRTPDALIAATALEHRLPLVTRNERDFSGIRGLKLRGPL